MSDFAKWLREWEESGNVKRLSYTEDLVNLCAQQAEAASIRESYENKERSPWCGNGHECQWCEQCVFNMRDEERAALRAAEEFQEKYG